MLKMRSPGWSLHVQISAKMIVTWYVATAGTASRYASGPGAFDASQRSEPSTLRGTSFRSPRPCAAAVKMKLFPPAGVKTPVCPPVGMPTSDSQTLPLPSTMSVRPPALMRHSTRWKPGPGSA